MIQPRKSSFNAPTLGQYLPPRLDSFRYVNCQSKNDAIFLKGLAIASIGANAFERRIFQAGFCQNVPASLCVVDVCGMDFSQKQKTLYICDDMPFVSLRFFPPSMPISSAAPVVLTLCESMRPYEGAGSRPTEILAISTMSALMTSHIPRIRIRRKKDLTAVYFGKSFGSISH